MAIDPLIPLPPATPVINAEVEGCDAGSEREVVWVDSPEHRDAAAVSAATRLDFDQVAGRATMRSPVFLANSDDATLSATLIYDAHLGYLLAVDMMGPHVSSFSRVVDPLEVSRPLLWRRRDRGEVASAETAFCTVARSLLLRHRDIGLALLLRSAGDEIGIGLPAHLLGGFLSRAESGFPRAPRRGSDEAL